MPKTLKRKQLPKNKSQKKKRKSKYDIQKFALRVKRGISGKGLFTEEAIPKGVCIIEYTGKEIKKEDQERLEGRYLFWTGKNKMVDGNVSTNPARYINHSCRPNCEADGPDGRIFILTRRKIKAGEEITYDYGKDYWNDYIKPKGCQCVKCKE